MIRFNTAGLHQLRVLVDGVDICGSPFSVCVKRQQLVNFAKGLDKPYGIAATDDGQHVLVTELIVHDVAVLSSTGQVVRRIGSCGSEHRNYFVPWDVAVSADKHIFVVDYDGRLQKFSFSLTCLASYYTTNFCTGIAVHPTSGKVFCTSWAKCKIKAHTC